MHTLILQLNRSRSSVFILAPFIIVSHFDLADLFESLIIVVNVWHGVLVAEKAYFATNERILLSITIAVVDLNLRRLS